MNVTLTELLHLLTLIFSAIGLGFRLGKSKNKK